MSTYNCKCGLAAMAPCLGFLRFHPFRSVGKIFQPLENDECTKGLRLQAEMLRSAEQGRSDDEKLNALAKARQIEKVVFPFSTRAQVWLIGQTCQQRATKYPKDRKHSGDLVLEPVALETRFFASSSGPAPNRG